MPATKDKKSKSKLLKIDMSSGSDDDSEHELSYYAKDKVKLMKEVLKLIKPKKIKSMAPECIKHLDVVEINSMLLEELLGISHKRLQYIFNGENADRETSSSDSEDEKQPIDVISLDDISDDDDIELCISQNERESLESGLSKKSKEHKPRKIKTEPNIKIKSETLERTKKKSKKSKERNKDDKIGENLKENEKEKLLSVLELLELQARARAIRSQLAIETEKKNQSVSVEIKHESDSDSDAVIVDSPQHKQIIITSDSDEEGNNSRSRLMENINSEEIFNNPTDIDVPPHKKQKKSDENLTVVNTIIDEIGNKSHTDIVVTVNLTEHEKGRDTDLNIRKDKLLNKVQKIKLIRKNAINVNIANNKSDSNNSCSDTVTETNNAATTNLDESGENSNSKDMQHISESISHNSEANRNNSKKQCESEIHKSQSSQNTEKMNDVLENHVIKKQNVNDCDNDEIVINLDEDEMDDMEND